MAVIARMLADCTGTRHEVHESYNRNITKKVHQRTGERSIENTKGREKDT